MARAKRQEREQARILRAQGLSLRAIARRLDVSPASVSVWVRDVGVPGPPRPEPEVAPKPQAEAPFRRCSRCERTLPASAFNRHDRGRRQWWCRECFKSYFQDRGERHLEQVKAGKRRRQAEGRDLIRRYLETYPCVDCGEADPLVLEFDHLRDKRAAVSWLRVTAHGRPALLEEISKCEVACANCHRRRTARRAGWWRLNPDSDPPPFLSKCQARNVQHIFTVLKASGCVDCGENDLVVLDFDHVGAKRATVTRLAYGGYSLRRLNEEMSVCQVRCANCHRRRTKLSKEAA
jgi:helix-turn-helix protein